MSSNAIADRIAVGIMKTGAFKADTVLAAVKDFFDFGFESSYFELHDEAQIANHVYGYMCALVAPVDANGKSGFSFGSEHATHAFYFSRSDEAAVHATEDRIERYLERHLSDHTRAISVRTYTSKAVPSLGGTDGSLVTLYSIERSLFPPLKAPLTNATAVPKAQWSLETLASERFAVNRNEKSLNRYKRLIEQLRTSIDSVEYTVDSVDNGTLALQIAFTPDRASYFSPLSVLMSTLGKQVVITKKFLETFRNGVQVYSFYVKGTDRSALEQVGSVMSMMPNRKLLKPVTDLFMEKLLSANETLYATVLVMFAFYFTPAPKTDDFTGLLNTLEHNDAGKRKLKNLRDELFRELMSEEFICTVLVRHIELFQELYADFAKGTTPASAQQLRDAISRRVSNKTERDVFLTFAKFNAAVRRTNFFKVGVSAVAFRLDASFIGELDFPRVPYAIYMIVGSHFRGFHLRFADIARGGIRIINSRGETPADVARAYQRNKSFLFQENYNLAYTQMLKNKDIPESGSKGTILVSTRAAIDPMSLYMQYIDGLLDLMIPDVPGVRDTLGKEEILFLGPDEGTAGDYPSTAALYAKKRGYKHWKSFTTGKGPAQGGIPHDTYGMTTRGVRAYAVGLYSKLGLDETKLTKFMTGGPDGDLGSNEILMGRERIIGICDGFASVHDPDGINREELVRLAKGRHSLKHFDVSKLTSRGFLVAVDEHNKKLPDGTVVADGTQFRNDFHFSRYADADVFVPCGGRPAAVNLHNVTRMLKDAPNVTADAMLSGKGNVPLSKLRFRYIIEGANLFFTHEARLALENSGVHQFKDSSTNKGGVTSSSLEVLTGLALTDAEHAEHMCIAPGQPIPAFYQSSVDETCKRIVANASKEFNCIWNETQRGYLGGSKTLVSDALSVKINTIKTFVQSSTMHHDAVLFKYVVSQYMLETTLSKVPIQDVMRRVPEAYLIAIFAIYIASHFVYETGLEQANEFSFFQFMHQLHTKAYATQTSAAVAKL